MKKTLEEKKKKKKMKEQKKNYTVAIQNLVRLRKKLHNYIFKNQ